MRQRRALIARTGALLGRGAETWTPRVLAVLTFLSGAVLLLSGATPAAAGRLSILDQVLPLGVIEMSHFTASVAGAVLLILSHGLSRRLDAAYYATAVTLLVGTVASLLKGFDYEEACLLVVTLAVLLRARGGFDRRAAFFATRFSTPWLAAVAGALAGSIWLGFFAFKHVDYSDDLWWQFELDGEASRFLRASVGAGLTLLLMAVARLMSVAPPDIATPSAADLDDAERAIAVAVRDVAVPVAARRQGPAVRRHARRVRDVRRPGPHLGRHGRPGVRAGATVRTGSRLSRALRRLRRHAGVLRNRQGASPRLCRLRDDVRRSWARRRASISPPTHCRGRRRRSIGRPCGVSRRMAQPSASSIASTCPRSCRSCGRCPTIGSTTRRRRRRDSRSASSTRPTSPASLSP